MGGIPTNYFGEVLNPTAQNPNAIYPGLMAVGEAGCASVHGANRLGSNSLIDLVVFGRAAAIRAGEIVDPKARFAPVNTVEVDRALDRFDATRHAKGPVPTAELRLEMQKTMQADAAVFRTDKTLADGVAKMTAIARARRCELAGAFTGLCGWGIGKNVVAPGESGTADIAKGRRD